MNKAARVGRYAAITILVVSAGAGLLNGPPELKAGANALQKSVGVGQIGYALTALAVIAALWFRPQWAVRLAILWAALVALTVTIAVIAWPAEPASSILAVLITTAVGALVVRLIWTGVQSAGEA